MSKSVISVVSLSFVVFAACMGAPPAESTTTEDSRVNFVRILYDTVGTLTTLRLSGYGCYCGTGNDVGVQPVDGTDSCCMTHDYAWIDAPQGCNCADETYAYSTTGGAITCGANNNACAAYCCAADKAFAECVQRNPPGTNTGYDRRQCEPFECYGDEDCESGTWCSGNRCVPMCGGGVINGVAAAIHCQDPTPTGAVPTPTTATSSLD